MEISLQIKLNDKLFLKNPLDSGLGRNIISHGLLQINKLGFESFTFRKLAEQIGTTEASVYRYFENKHKLLLYFFGWYWSSLEYKLIFYTNNIIQPEAKLRKILDILAQPYAFSAPNEGINEKALFELILREGSKAYLTRHVEEDNKEQLFKPYKDLCASFAEVIKEFKPAYRFPRSLASTVVETAHVQRFYMQHLPSLNEFGQGKDEKKFRKFLDSLLFDTLV